ncbi:hypothetical protein [Aquimarina rhabdastrellae]
MMQKLRSLENKKALKLIDKILADIDRVGIITNTLIEDLKTLRPFAIEEEIPLVVKVIRLTYEHIEKYETFAIPIPDDEPIEGEEMITDEAVVPEESLYYVIALLKDTSKKVNVADLRVYCNALIAYAEEN